MQTNQRSRNAIGEAYSKDYWSTWPDVFDDLCAKAQDHSHVVSEEKVNNVFRSVLASEYLQTRIPPGGRVLDVASGIGYNACYLAKLGYDVLGFDISETGVERARALARRLDLKPEIFVHADHTFLESLEEGSFDAAIAMGFFRYLDAQTRDHCYRHLARVIRRDGALVLTNQNKIFEAFALNEGSLQFWSEMIEEFSDARSLLASRTVLERLKESVSLPPRRFAAASISRVHETNSQNPLTYHHVVEPYGFTVERIVYPDCHLLPPMLEAAVDKEKLLALKAKTCVQKADDWRGLFMGFEFMSFLRRR